MGLYSIKPKFQQFLSPIGRFFVRHNIDPLILNLAGLFTALFAGLVLFFSDRTAGLLLLVPPLLFARIAFNALDGIVSRELKVDSRFGEVLNEFFDRLADVIIFLGLAFIPISNIALSSATIMIILLNSYLSILSKAAGGSRQYGGFMGKADRMLYLGLAALAVFFSARPMIWNYLLWFILGGTLLTLGQRFIAVKRELS